MSNLKAARQAILAELRHVEAGVAYYQQQAAALRAALEQLDRTGDPAATSVKSAGAAAKTGKNTRRSGNNKRSGARKASSSHKSLPKTSQEFWLGFIGQEPKTAADIGNAAIASLGFEPTPEQARQLKSRLAPTLQALLNARKIKDTGSGRNRKYSLASAKGTTAAKAKTTSSAALSGTAGSANGNAVHH